NHHKMKTITILQLALALSFLPALLFSQTTVCNEVHSEPVNYYAEFADLMHREADAGIVSAQATSVDRFKTYVLYRETTNGLPEGFSGFSERLEMQSVSNVEFAFGQWISGQITGGNQPLKTCKNR
ncbi:MAG: hypothetical protein D6698_01670, partial [Gammaproteobacteria bacterium]